MKYIILVSVLFIAGCAAQDVPVAPITVQSKPIPRPPLNLPSVTPITSQPVKWIIVTPDNVDEIFAQMKADGKDPVIFGVDGTGYKNLSLNVQESLRVILQQQAVIDGYHKYYVIVDGNIRSYNSSIAP